MHTKLSTRKAKPEECPKELLKFKRFFALLPVTPLGPEYIGNYSFDTDRLMREDVEHIKSLSEDGFSVIDITEDLIATKGVMTRAEAVAQHVSKASDFKYWNKITHTTYMKMFKKQHARSEKEKNRELFKPFVIWCVEYNFADHQIARVLEVTPPVIRRWRNEFGYKDHTKIMTVTADTRGKAKRVEHVQEVPTGEQATMNFRHNEVSQTSTGLKAPRAVRGPYKKTLEKMKEIATNIDLKKADRTLTDYSTDDLVNALNLKGYSVSLTKHPMQVDIETVGE